MKQLCLLFIFSLISFVSFANGENVVVATNTGDGIAETPGELGPVNPCTDLYFKVNVFPPQPDFVIAGKYEWFVNGVLVKTSTDPSDPFLKWHVSSSSASAYCKVTYKKQNGDLSSPYTSTTFTPIIKALNFADITNSTPPANYGCNNAVSYSPNTFDCGSNCDYTYKVGDYYNITWQPPAGWVQTSISAKGNDVSFIPDATTDGTLTATITLTCGFTTTKAFAINRVASATAFSATNPVSVCGSTATMSVNPVCGATSYTYTLTGSPGVTFASNGLQTLTIANSSVDLNLSGAPSTNTIKAKVNYPGSNTSPEVSTQFNYGVPTPILNAMQVSLPGEPTRIEVYATYSYGSTDPIPGVTYKWYLNGSLTSATGNKYVWYIPCNRTSILECEIVNSCGTSTKASLEEVGGCRQLSGSYIVAPNPAANTVTVSPTELNSTETANITIDEVRVYDLQGNLKKHQKFNKVKKATLNINDLKTGNYTIEVIGVNFSEKKQLLIRR